MVSSVLLAHQGGWDEALMVLGPIALLFGLLWLANKRAARGAPDDQANELALEPEEDEPTSRGPGGPRD